MICPRCNAGNPDNGNFCFHCGLPFSSAPSIPNEKTDRTLKFLLFFALWIVGNFLIWDIITYAIDPMLKSIYGEGGSYYRMSEKIYSIYGWLSSLASIAVAIIALIKVKGKLAKTVMIAYLVIVTVDLAVYRIAPLFKPQDNYSFYNF